MAKFSEIMLEEFNTFLKDKNVIIPNFEKVDLDEDIPLYGGDAEWIKERIEDVVETDWLIISLNDFEGYVIEVLEDFLDEIGIVINNEEKSDAIKSGESADELANIYGTDYGELQNAVEYGIETADDMEKYRDLFNVRDFEFEQLQDDLER